MGKKSTGEYPDNWDEIAKAVKDAAGWKCIRCEHPHDPPAGRMLTVHHMDLNKSNCEWWNLAALCQACHLKIQGRFEISQFWMFRFEKWIQPYVAGYYAHLLGQPEDRKSVMANKDRLLNLSTSPRPENINKGW